MNQEKHKKLTEFTTPELIESLARQEKVSLNKTLLKSLPDKGKKVLESYHQTKAELLRRKDYNEVTESFQKTEIEKIEFLHGSNAIWCHFKDDDSDDDETPHESVFQSKIKVLQDEKPKESSKIIKKPTKHKKENNPFQEIFPLYSLQKGVSLSLDESVKLISEHRIKLEEAEQQRNLERQKEKLMPIS